VCAVTVSGRAALASAGADNTVRVWDVASGEQQQRLEGHGHFVFGVCAVTVDGRTLLASAGGGKTVRLWDPATGRPEATIPVRHPATGCAPAADGGLGVGTTAGVLVVQVGGATGPAAPTN
jgi:WD40 repeat protein